MEEREKNLKLLNYVIDFLKENKFYIGWSNEKRKEVAETLEKIRTTITTDPANVKIEYKHEPEPQPLSKRSNMDNTTINKKEALELIESVKTAIRTGSKVKERGFLEVLQYFEGQVATEFDNTDCSGYVNKILDLSRDVANTYEPVFKQYYLKGAEYGNN